MGILVVDTDNLAKEVGQVLHNADVWNAPVEGIAHGTLIRVCLAMNATVCMVAVISIRVKVAVCSVVPASDVHIQPEFNTLLVTLGQQQIVGMTTGPATICYQLSTSTHSLISFLDELLEGNAV